MIDEELVFLDEDEADIQPIAAAQPNWKVLIVDDEEEIHSVTKMVLNGFEFRGAGIDFISAYSGAEAREKLAQHPDIAAALVDVVMETDDAGLEFTRYIREIAKNETMRIILRTGQPGQAPEREVILGYDINDYKEKSELTAQKLFSTMVTALRSYRDIMAIEASRRGLEKIIEASASLSRIDSMETFLSGVLIQIGSLLEISVDTVLVSADGDAAMQVMAATGRFADTIKQDAASALPVGVWEKIARVLETRESVFKEDFSVVYFHSQRSRVTAVYVETLGALNEIDHSLLHLFCANASIGLDNLLRRQDN